MIRIAVSFFSIAALAFNMSHAQRVVPDAGAVSVNSPIAFVYVSSSPSGFGKGSNVVNAFAAAANGKLTSIPGSPFHDNLTDMVVNGKYLFGNTGNGVYLAQFLIEPNGALHWTKSTDVDNYDQPGCSAFPGPLALDHSGATLYNMLLDFVNCGSDIEQSFTIEKPSGNLKYLGTDNDLALFSTAISFTGNNVYAYGAECDFFDHEPEEIVSVFERQKDGRLISINANTPPPTSPNPDDSYCPNLTAADPTNHLVISVQLVDDDGDPLGTPPQLATFTADKAGNLSTTSTYKNMPVTAFNYIFDLKMSPSGKLLAVAGDTGLQIFHFNGAAPISHYTGLLVKDSIGLVYWDNANHLYAIGRNKVYVFTVTPTSVSQATGSPYIVKNPVGLIVQPRSAPQKTALP